jgi:hypothetical protein
VHRAGNAVEPGVERGDDGGGLGRLGESGEVAQIGAEQRGADRLAGATAYRAGLHPRGTAPAQIGFEQCRHRGPCAQRCQWRRGEAACLAQPVDLGGTEGAGSGPGQHRIIRRRSDGILMHGAKPSQPVMPGVADRTVGEAQRLDDRPGSARHSQVRREIMGCGTASVRAPPASGTPSAKSRPPSSVKKPSGLGEAVASSTSQAMTPGRPPARSNAKPMPRQ